MLRYLVQRLLYTLPVIWLVVSVVFFLIHLVPGDPIQQMLGEGVAVADLAAARHAYKLDLPLGQQYWEYCKVRSFWRFPPACGRRSAAIGGMIA
jgi:peptide/nickel transport system permease protein